MAMTCKQDRNP